MAWAQDADQLISCDQGGKLILWQPSAGKLISQLDSGTSLSHLASSHDGKAIAAIDGEHKLRFWRWTDKLVPAELEAAKPIIDAKAIVLANKPAPALVLASESAGVLVITTADGKQVRKIDHGSAVDALAISPDGTQLATGGRDGKTRLWKTENGEAIRTLEGDTESRIQISVADRDVKRQKAAVARLESRTGELEKALAKEDEAVKKVTEERDKAKTKVGEETKKHTDAVAKVTATETGINKAKADMQTAETNANAAKKKISEQENLKKTVALQVAQAKAARDKVAEQLAAEEKKYKEAVDKMTAVESEIAKAQADQQTATKTLADSKTQLDNLTKQLEADKKAATAAEEAKKKSDADLAKREQALSSGRHRGSSSGPPPPCRTHKQRCRIRKTSQHPVGATPGQHPETCRQSRTLGRRGLVR